MKWFKRTATCSTCGGEFRKRRNSLPSLVGFSYCTTACESAAWSAWVKGSRTMIRSGTPAAWPTPTPIRRRTHDCMVWEDRDTGTFYARRGSVTLRVPPMVLAAIFEAAR